MRKLKFLFAILPLAILFVGCLKNKDEKPCVSKTPEEERPDMVKFATDNAITYQQHSSGILYEIIEPGTGATPTASSNVKAKYEGKFLNGVLFDENKEGISFNLSGVIPGWTIAIPLIKAGGKIKIIIPSSLAYDCNPNYRAFHNKPLYFYVELLEVN